MWFRNIVILFFISLFASDYAFSQETPVKKDSTQLYRDIESFSKKSRFTNFIYRMVFKPVKAVLPKKLAKKKRYKKLIQKPYSTFEGKTIRNINIEHWTLLAIPLQIPM
jgi:hypothetical protein